jgi:cystathionine gamma-synthase
VYTLPLVRGAHPAGRGGALEGSVTQLCWRPKADARRFHRIDYRARDTHGLESVTMATRTDRHIAEFSSPDSLLVAAGRDGRPGSPLNMPPVLASNFVLGTERTYARGDGTPTWEALEDIIGLLEGGRAVAFASGMAGVAAIFDQLHAGSRVVLPGDCYQGVAKLAESGRKRGLWSVTRLAVDDTEGWIGAAAGADLLWLESPSNPLLVVADLSAICSAPRKPSTLLVVDNTFATSLNQRPLDLGADLSFQSATKFIGGHSDLLAGLVTVRKNELLVALRQSRELNGATPGALESFLAVRGARTMALRLERAQASAMILAKRLSSHSNVACTRFPGLDTHPTHSIARRQLKGFGTIISFDVRGDAAAADEVCSRVRLIQHATSLGAVESTLERRAGIPGQEHLPPSLIRLSVGIENVEDLWSDLDAALKTHG